MDRTSEIVKVSIRGVAVNLLLVIFKAVVGFTAHSVAVILDAVNNLSDAFSSVITIFGTKLAGKDADKKHPYGHGRIEYITSSVVAVIVLTAGITSLKESVLKIVNPAETAYTAISVFIIAAAVAVKLLLGKYFSKKGEEFNSASLKASGADASFDAVISGATLISAVINMHFGLNLEGWLGVIISAFILKTGIEIIIESVSSIIGTRIDDELAVNIKNTLNAHKEVYGSYDLILHNYGPDAYIGSVHVEVSDSMTAKEIDTLSRELSYEIYDKYGVILTIGIYATNTESEKGMEIRAFTEKLIKKYPQVLQLHGFYIDEKIKNISFDLIIDFSETEKTKLTGEIKASLEKEYPDFEFDIRIDRDFSE